MPPFLEATLLHSLGIEPASALQLADKINEIFATTPPDEAWHHISTTLLSDYPFPLHLFLFKKIFPNWPQQLDSAPAWSPNEEIIKHSNITRFMHPFKLKSLAELHHWSVDNFRDFWQTMLITLGISFDNPPEQICDLQLGVHLPQWLKGAKLNIVNSCFNAPSEKVAIRFFGPSGFIEKLTYGELHKIVNRIANSLIQFGLKPHDAIAIDMPMTPFAVAIYLGIIKMGGVVVSIADSFSKDEIAIRLKIANTRAIFTQDFILRDHKKLPLYEKVTAANAPVAIVLPCEEELTVTLRQGDIAWQNFLTDKDDFQAYSANPMDAINILFSSGTTGIPKAIPWNHTTPIKTASDAFFHQNIQPDDVLAWPTNLGWMMGPWLIFAALINQAELALYDGVPRDKSFGEFVQEAHVTMLGVVPTLVASWRESQCMENFDWSHIKVFSSTGECSNPEDMLYLMSLAGYKPVIEYCGGTEIGGAYISSTVVEKNYPSVFTTPTLGTNFIILDESGQKGENGEVALIPPVLGLSTQLLNGDHYHTYYADMPLSPSGQILRRHGDQLVHLKNGGYCILGRTDDTMNLGGIKVSSAEIERVLAGIENIIETAAVAVTPLEHGPSRLVIFAATRAELDKEKVKQTMQQRINQHLNPLFKIYDVKFIKELPKTASNKIMRRKLRE